jgi:hypothetical protein
MKFTTIFSTILCALSLGVTAAPAPVPNEIFTLVARTTTAQEINAYSRLSAVKPDMVAGTTYVFTLKAAKDPKEADPLMVALTERLGYGHISIITGQMVQTESGPPKKRVLGPKRFVGMIHDLGMKGGTKAVFIQHKDYAPSSPTSTTSTLTYLKTAKNAGQINAWSKFSAPKEICSVVHC